MSRKNWGKAALIAGALLALLALDAVASLQGLPLLVLLLGGALLATERLRSWLHAHERAGVAMLPFMAAGLVLMLAFTRGRDLSQGVLLLVTLGLVFDILLVALALIGEVGKRGLRGVGEFLALTLVGVVLGCVLSVGFVVGLGRLGDASLASP